jgi:hypothetical protein
MQAQASAARHYLPQCRFDFLAAGWLHAAGATARVVLSTANDVVLWPLALSLWRSDRAWTVRACVAGLFVRP